MKRSIAKKSVIIFILFLIVFVATETVFAETLSDKISITAPIENQSILAESDFKVEYDIGSFGFMTTRTAKLYFQEKTSLIWSFVSDLDPDESIYKWSVPDTMASKARLKIVVTVNSSIVNPIPSKPVTYYNLSENFRITKAIDYPVKPNPPVDLIAEATSASKIEINWTDKSSNEFGFRIERKTESSSFAEIADVAKDKESFVDTDLEPESTYFYRVLAYNARGESDFSNTASTKTEALESEEEEEEEEEEEILPIVMKFYIDNSDYFVDDQIMTMDTAPIILENRTVLPIRYVVEPLGGDVGWDPVDKRVDIALGGKVINLWIGNNIASVNGTMVLIDPDNANVKPVVVPPGRTMLPLRFIAESLGAEVGWDAPTKQVTVTYPAP